MTSHDVRDMLDLPGTAAPRPTKKAKTVANKPKLAGLAREVQNLGGDNPIAIVPEGAVFKKKRFVSRKPAARWEPRKFRNSAREDAIGEGNREAGLVLRHWRKIVGRVGEGEQSGGNGEGEGSGNAEKKQEVVEDSAFAQYNVKVIVPTYNDEEYKERLQSDDWTRHETDYLMELARAYDMRWPVIWDRYEFTPPTPEDASADAMVLAPKTRTLEDLKARFYFVGANMMEVKTPLHEMTTAEFEVHQKMLHFSPRQERQRKEFLEHAFTRNREEISEEQSLMVELKRILNRTERMNEERRELYARLDTPQSSGNISMFTSSQGLNNLLQQLMTSDKAKKRKALPGADQTPTSGTPGAQTPSASAFPDRRDSSHRESISGPPTSALKKGSISLAPERRKLSEEEEKIYGVTHHDRLQGGPYFRGDKLARPLTMKSSVQQTRIKNTLAELSIPEKAMMATTDVAIGYEGLFASIGVLLDCRKVVDKLSGEIAVAREALEEKKRRQRRREAMNTGLDGTDDGTANADENDEKGKENEKDISAVGEEKPEVNGHAEDKAEVVTDTATNAPSNSNGEGEAKADVSEKTEEVDAQKSLENSASGSAEAEVSASATHKRSASVLSEGSDNGAKRLKK